MEAREESSCQRIKYSAAIELASSYTENEREIDPRVPEGQTGKACVGCREPEKIATLLFSINCGSGQTADTSFLEIYTTFHC